jgi:acylphosphatase
MSDTRPPPVAVRVLYAGRVQGVGFRAIAADIARSYPVGGWVRNLTDGRVELWAEGPEADVTAYLAALRRYWGDAITDAQTERREPAGHGAGLRVMR